MKKSSLVMSVLLILGSVLSACNPKGPAPADSDVLYLNITWHQHQPLYYKDADGVYTRPWVRVHATKDYYDMAYLVSRYPNVHVTFNLTPVLLKQIDDYVDNGAKDLYWTMAEKPADGLSQEDKTFILQRFFDANTSHIIARFPRYKELLDKRGSGDDASIQSALQSFSAQDFLDLQIWFNLAWFDPMFLEQPPLSDLVSKGNNFSEADKKTIFDQVRKVMSEIVPLHKQLQEKGQIEVITTPYAHPILPLLIDSNLESVGNPGADLPQQFSYPTDALAQLEKSVSVYQDHFGVAPRGLWPGEGSVAQVMVPYVLKAGYSWMASGEPVLAKSLGLDAFTRDSNETVKQADDLYRPYFVQNSSGQQLAVFFRDGNLSDKIGFTYSGVSGEAAASDLMQRLENIRTQLKDENASGPHVVSIILDGENAWENYDNDGKDFLNALYQKLTDSKTIKTITPSDYLKTFPEQRSLDDLFPGAWFSANYETWIGEQEENTAWDYLRRTREVLAKYDISKVRNAPAEEIAQAEDFMYLAEGSDWFWWYGSDQDFGQDTYFDTGFRSLLGSVYQALGEEVPAYVNVPIIQANPVSAATTLNGLSTPLVDGSIGTDEWSNAASYPAADPGKTPWFAYTLDEKNLYFRVEAPSGGSMARTLTAPVAFYLLAPRSPSGYPFTSSDNPVLTGIAATHALVWDGGSDLQLFQAGEDGWTAGERLGSAAPGPGVLEASIPLNTFGELEAGDELRLVVAAGGDQTLLPEGGPAQIVMPDLGLSTVVFDLQDPQGDDYGPGSYTYASDAVFLSKAFDLKSFQVSYDEKNLIFKLGMYGPIQNPWGSPNGLAIQTFDIYIDQDPGAGTGARLLLPGRNAALASGNGWEYALWIEGWTPQVVIPAVGSQEPAQLTEASLKILVDPAARTVTVRVPLDTFGGGDPSQWGYAVTVEGQEGYPSSGVWRIRDVETQATQWKFGGAPADSNHTRILDMLWPADRDGSQEEMLSKYTASTADVGTLGPDDFAQIELVRP